MYPGYGQDNDADAEDDDEDEEEEEEDAANADDADEKEAEAAEGDGEGDSESGRSSSTRKRRRTSDDADAPSRPVRRTRSSPATERGGKSADDDDDDEDEGEAAEGEEGEGEGEGDAEAQEGSTAELLTPDAALQADVDKADKVHPSGDALLENTDIKTKVTDIALLMNIHVVLVLASAHPSAQWTKSIFPLTCFTFHLRSLTAHVILSSHTHNDPACFYAPTHHFAHPLTFLPHLRINTPTHQPPNLGRRCRTFSRELCVHTSTWVSTGSPTCAIASSTAFSQMR
jgi:hypothetical protein